MTSAPQPQWTNDTGAAWFEVVGKVLRRDELTDEEVIRSLLSFRKEYPFLTDMCRLLDPLVLVLRALTTHNRELSDRLSAMLKGLGKWSAERDYSAGNLVQRQGGMWIALSDSRGLPPGTALGASSWRLIDKTEGDAR